MHLFTFRFSGSSRPVNVKTNAHLSILINPFVQHLYVLTRICLIENGKG